MPKSNLTFNRAAWRQLTKDIINSEGVDRMKRVADAANRADDLEDGYRVSIEGDDPLDKRDYRATVITATAEAMRANARSNTLISNFHQASG